ncbi:hypothetical protein ACIG54_14645 [Streptomyces achromogenes]|uniref:hypothetical protein n=1 Tax=Streptomyces achromogenes TaxID=67255 RepID=UPI0037CE3669
MNRGMRRTAMASGTALLLCLGTVGTAIADEELPAPAADASERPVSTDDIATQGEIDINDRTGWENGEVTSVVTPQYCDGPQTWIEITSKKNYHVPSWWNDTSYKDGPGGSMTVSVTKAGTVGMEISAGAEAEADTYSHIMSSRKYGHLQYGSWGHKVSWKKWRRRGSGCGSPTLVTSGTATLPTKETGWKYWETSS